MLWITCVFALVFCLCSSTMCAEEPQCKTSKIQVVLKCHHNDSGTWQSQVVFKHDAKDSQGENNPPWVTDVNQETHNCEDGQSTLETIINLEAPGVQKTPNVSQFLYHTAEQKKIPEGYELFHGVGYYKFHRDVANWPVARDMCAQEGGHLVIINSEAEREVVRRLFVDINPKTKGSSQQEQIHTGVKRNAEGKHVTIFGVPLENTGFSSWFPGQPCCGDREPCVSIMSPSITFNDISCKKEILAFICEIEL